MLMPVSDLKFAQPARRNLLVPVLLAFLILGIVLALVLKFTPHKTADLAITRTAIYPAHTVFRSESIIVANQHAEDDLYVLTTLRIDDRLHLPLFLKDFTADLVTADGQQFTTSAVEERDLPNLYTSFPGLRDHVPTTLLRETMIAPGASAEGVLVLHFPVTKEIWDHRRTAVLNVDLYHQGEQEVLIGRASEVAPSAAPTPSPISSPTN
jgi:hypothetical protein